MEEGGAPIAAALLRRCFSSAGNPTTQSRWHFIQLRFQDVLNQHKNARAPWRMLRPNIYCKKANLSTEAGLRGPMPSSAH